MCTPFFLSGIYIIFRAAFGEHFTCWTQIVMNLLSKDSPQPEIAALFLEHCDWANLSSRSSPNYWMCTTVDVRVIDRPYAISCKLPEHVGCSYKTLSSCRKCKFASLSAVKKDLHRLSVAVMDYVKVRASHELLSPAYCIYD